MAIFANIAGSDMSAGFTAGLNAVMAGYTVADNRAVIDRRRFPCSRAMTDVAFVGGRNVSWQLTAGDDAVMTRTAYAVDLGMIHDKEINPSSRKRCVTSAAIITGIDMLRTFTAGNHAVVATFTTTEYFLMIDRGFGHRRPTRWRHSVTGDTVITGV